MSKIVRLFCPLFLVCVLGSQIAQAQAQFKLQQPQAAIGFVLSCFSQDVPADANTGPLYASLQAYWNNKLTQTMNGYTVSGAWFVTFSLQNAAVPKTGQVVQVLIVQSFEGATVSRLTEINLQGDVNLIKEANETLRLLLMYTNAKVKNPLQTVRHTIG